MKAEYEQQKEINSYCWECKPEFKTSQQAANLSSKPSDPQATNSKPENPTKKLKKRSKKIKEYNKKCHQCNTVNMADNFLICSNKQCNTSFCIKCVRRYHVIPLINLRLLLQWKMWRN